MMNFSKRKKEDAKKTAVQEETVIVNADVIVGTNKGVITSGLRCADDSEFCRIDSNIA